MYAFPYNIFMLFYELFFCVLAYFVIDALRFRNTAIIFSQTLRPIVYDFLNYRSFANLVAPPTEGSAKYLVRYKVHLVP